MKLPIIYGAVDKQRLHGTENAPPHPLAAAFEAWAPGAQKWFRENAPKDIGLIISDDTGDKRAKTGVRKAFRQCRKRLRVGSTWDVDRGLLDNFMDDIYFGDSADSIGIQMADVCGFFICRHLCRREDSEHLYKMIENNIYYEKLIPEKPTYKKPATPYEDEVIAKTKQLMTEKKIESFGDAMRIVLSENQELAARYQKERPKVIED